MEGEVLMKVKAKAWVRDGGTRLLRACGNLPWMSLEDA